MSKKKVNKIVWRRVKDNGSYLFEGRINSVIRFRIAKSFATDTKKYQLLAGYIVVTTVKTIKACKIIAEQIAFH